MLYYPSEGDDVATIAQRWGNQYGVCQFKQKVLSECIEAYEKTGRK